MFGPSQLPSGDPIFLHLDSESSPEFMTTEGEVHRHYLLTPPTQFVLNSVDTAVQQYIAHQGIGERFHRYRCLIDCMTAEPKRSLDLATLFWATQCKQAQLDYWCLAASTHLTSSQNRLLCAKCGKWILVHDFLAHLNYEQLVAVFRDPPGLDLEDASPECRRAGGMDLSDNELLLTTQLREYHLLQPDWLTVCPICHCIVMHAFMHLHESHIKFCKQSSLANNVAGGTISGFHRFAWYPGSPSSHLFCIGKWKIVTILALRTGNFQDLVSLREAFLPCMLLCSYRQAPVFYKFVLEFLTDYTSLDLEFLCEMLFAQRYDVAQWTIKARLRNHIRRFQSNILNM